MTEKTAQSVANLGYHAHIYYDPARTRAVAERVCAAVSEKFPVQLPWSSAFVPVGAAARAGGMIVRAARAGD